MADSGWRETTVGVLCDEGVLHTQTGPFGSQLHSYDYVPSGVPVVPTEGIGRRRLLTEGIPEVAEETAARLSRHRLKAGDILFARRGVQATGLSAIVTPRQEGWLCGTGAILLRIKGKAVDPEFLSFLLSAEESVLWLKQHAVGAVMPNLNEGVIRQIPLTLPPLAEQKAIAAVLGALDDKIELNRRMNATLEAMARALFQSWFVDFDPVRRNLDRAANGKHKLPTLGKDPAATFQPLELDALFPASFQESSLGHIPTGWETSTIGAKLQTVLGGTPSRAKPEYWTDGTVAWINSGKTNEFRIIEPSEWITKEALENSATKILPRRTTVLAITGATLGQVSITEIECCANQSVVAIPASEEFPTEFIYPWIEENIEKLIASQTGGAQQHINKGNVEELVLLCPDGRVVAAYQTKAKPLFDQIAANCFQSRTLATLRDTLLPKLLSGELSTKSVAQTTEGHPTR